MLDANKKLVVELTARTTGTVLVLMVLALLAASPAGAHPNMIRLGYPSCAACHLSQQGGGLLTRYGQSIDLTQTLRPAQEVRPPELGEDALGSRLNYDARVSLWIDRRPPSPEEYRFGLSLRAAIGAGNHRLVSTNHVRSPILTRSGTTNPMKTTMSHLYWLYQPLDGVSFVVGRDDLPTGLGLPAAETFSRPVNNPNVSATPTQAKIFLWNERLQAAAYAYGPDWQETDPRFQARGGGVLFGVNVWDRAVLGVSTRLSKSDAFDRKNVGAFLRLGLSKQWGLLLEHDVTERTTDEAQRFVHLAGHSQLFFIPVDWFKTSLTAEHLTTRGGPATYRLTPAVQVRLTPNIKAQLEIQESYPQPRTRALVFEFQLKTQ